MKKLVLLSAFLCVLCGESFAQNWTTVTATNITDLNQQKLAAGQLCFLGTDQNDAPISFNVGGGGQVLRRAFCSAVSSGAVTAFTVPNPAQTTPAGIFYRVTVKDSSSGQEVLRYTQVTFNGATFNFDNYGPLNVGQVTPPSANVTNGNLTVNGNLSITGGLSGNVNIPALGTATSSANFGTANAVWNGSFWNGSAAVPDTWTINSWLAAGTSPNSFFGLNHSGAPGSFFSVNSNVQIPTTTAATVSNNVNSPMLWLIGAYWNGSSNSDNWMLQDILGSGANPATTLTFTHSGSTGATAIDMSSIGTLKTSTINVGASDTGLSRTAAGVVAAGNGAAGNSSGTFESRKLQLDGSTSGNTVVQSAAAASGTLTLPAATDTLVGRATTDTLTNKTLGGAGSTTPTTVYNRLKLGQGSAIVAGDFALSAGWGTTATKTVVLGQDGYGQFAVTSGGTGQAANPTITFTFHDGAFANAPLCGISRIDPSAPNNVIFGQSSLTTTQIQWTFFGTPVAGNGYTIVWNCQDR